MIKKITINGVPSMAGFGSAGCKPYFEIYQVVDGLKFELKYTNKGNKE